MFSQFARTKKRDSKESRNRREHNHVKPSKKITSYVKYTARKLDKEQNQITGVC